MYEPQSSCLTWLAEVTKGSGKKIFKVREMSGILFWVRESWHFEEKSGKIEYCETDLIPSKVGRNISGQMGAKDCCNWRLEATTIF